MTCASVSGQVCNTWYCRQKKRTLKITNRVHRMRLATPRNTRRPCFPLFRSELCFRLGPGVQHLVLPPEKGHAQNHEQSAQDEIGNSEEHQKAVFSAVQARILEIGFTTEDTEGAEKK